MCAAKVPRLPAAYNRRVADFEKLGAFYLGRGYDAAKDALEKIRVAPRKSDIAVGRVAIAWEPWRVGADGFPRPASTL
jgi:hypothetical protein